ncbi:hypothetical protein G6F63_015760 [Rhizopus arrhizus]|nr:hypothetical protein G6F63_015760 [Rhizopus arrhizus]
MIELYPHVLVLSTLYPKSPQETVTVAQRAADMETALEDDEIAERMDAGRKALLLRGVNEAGPYQSPMEDGMQHFHEWYRRIMQDV